ncbi:MAG: hypothetical protein J5I47_11775 [Vicingus serpentipes]|nr:hypothetical protein [Vicingus serpentipes]
MGGYLPYRYFISDYLWNGHLPLWNPFQRLGYPGYSDLQSGCWSPITWVIMLFGKYTVGSLMVELISYYIIAGLGMFQLSNFFYSNQKTSFIIALSYTLSGFMVGSTQLMVFIIGVACLPWCIYGILNYFKTFDLKYALLTALCISINTSAASPAYTIILAYIFLFLFLFYLWKNRKDSSSIQKIILGGIIIICSSILMLLPYINSFIEFAPYFNRISKLSYGEFLLSNPFTIIHYISFIFPYTVISATDIFNPTDITLRNGYFGIICFFFFLSTLLTIKKYNYINLPFIILLVVSLIFAAGSSTFVYQLIYQLPGFGVFRHPSFFRTYSIFLALLVGGFSLNKVIINNHISKKEIWLVVTLIVFFFIVMAFSFFYTSIVKIIELLSNVLHHQEISTATFYTHLFINSSLILLLTIIVFILKKVFKFSVFVAIVIFVCLDLGIQTRLTAPTTIYYNFTYKSVAPYFDNLPDTINQKNNLTPLKYLDEKQGLIAVNGIWENLSTFNKALSFVGKNPTIFKSFEEGHENGALQRNIENNILFFPEKEYLNGDTLQKGLVWGTATPINIIKGSTKINSIRIGYNSFDAQIENNASKKQWLLLNQNYHHLWKAYYNNQLLPIQKVNEMIIGVEIPGQSNGKVQFIYESPRTKYAFIISVLSYFLIVLYLFKRHFQQQKST